MLLIDDEGQTTWNLAHMLGLQTRSGKARGEFELLLLHSDGDSWYSIFEGTEAACEMVRRNITRMWARGNAACSLADCLPAGELVPARVGEWGS